MHFPDHWCVTCGFFYLTNKKRHKCHPNFHHCRYMVTSYGTRDVKPLFFCIFCHRFNLSAQRVICTKRNYHTLDESVIKSFRCNQYSTCRLHKERTAICLNNPGVNNLKIYTYFQHTRKFPSYEYAFCQSCKRYPEPLSLFCGQRYVAVSVRQFVKQYMLRDGMLFTRSPNLATAVIKSEHSVSLLVQY